MLSVNENTNARVGGLTDLVSSTGRGFLINQISSYGQELLTTGQIDVVDSSVDKKLSAKEKAAAILRYQMGFMTKSALDSRLGNSNQKSSSSTAPAPDALFRPKSGPNVVKIIPDTLTIESSPGLVDSQATVTVAMAKPISARSDSSNRTDNKGLLDRAKAMGEALGSAVYNTISDEIEKGLSLVESIKKNVHDVTTVGLVETLLRHGLSQEELRASLGSKYVEIERTYNGRNLSIDNIQMTLDAQGRAIFLGTDEIGDFHTLRETQGFSLPSYQGSFMGPFSANKSLFVMDRNGLKEQISLVNVMCFFHDSDYQDNNREDFRRGYGFFHLESDFRLISRLVNNKDRMLSDTERRMADVAIKYFSTIGYYAAQLKGLAYGADGRRKEPDPEILKYFIKEAELVPPDMISDDTNSLQVAEVFIDAAVDTVVERFNTESVVRNPVAQAEYIREYEREVILDAVEVYF